jgi:hypothetical protein
MKQFDPILHISTNFETQTGAAGNFPIDDDVLSGRILAESGAATQTDVTFTGSLVLQRYDERYAEYAEVGFSMAWRAQAAMAKSTNNPVPVRLLACQVISDRWHRVFPLPSRSHPTSCLSSNVSA